MTDKKIDESAGKPEMGFWFDYDVDPFPTQFPIDTSYLIPDRDLYWDIRFGLRPLSPIGYNIEVTLTYPNP